ncbi:MAG: hypothetical protein JO323_06520 [Acidobacteriia bacterium]|nr:hypothetical protein [Terriglobia bacterium]
MRVLRAFAMGLWLWFLPAMLSGAALSLLVAFPGGRWPWFVWLILAPWLYFCWLILFLVFCAAGIQRIAKRHPKPHRVVTSGGGLFTIVACNFRLRLVNSLPLIGVMRNLPKLRDLVMLSYAPSVHVGKGAQLAGFLWDPDLTEVGDFSVLGDRALVSAHLLMIQPDGKHSYVTAPVKIGNRVMVGTGATVTAGCEIGEFAIIQPHSFLPPFTKVPAGEIWGGSPATCQGSRKGTLRSLSSDSKVNAEFEF